MFRAYNKKEQHLMKGKIVLFFTLKIFLVLRLWPGADNFSEIYSVEKKKKTRFCASLETANVSSF